ncbi:MAG: 4Fe-4S binding protein [bacterium]|nr:4Fe-4S binding protein [bacterium]
MKYVPVILSFILLAAHYSRASQDWTALLFLFLPLLLFVKKKWVMRVQQSFLLFGSYVWIKTAVFLVNVRMEMGRPWLRLLIILGTVALFTLWGALMFEKKSMRQRYQQDDSPWIPQFSAFLLTVVLLAIVLFKVKLPMLLLERFLPGSGWIEVVLAAFYAGWLVEKLSAAGAAHYSRLRRTLWLVFSAVFFLQLAVGLAGIEKLLMTGKLHVPVPAMILAGPLLRGAGFFMPVLFLATLVIVGPAWCSFLCYVGSWDNAAAKVQKEPRPLPKNKTLFRLIILAVVAIVALSLRFAGVDGVVATAAGVLFGIAGVGVMILFSRKNGNMTHCVVYCPIGLLTNLIGRLSPFRLRIADTCTDCGACRSSCRYDALTEEDIKKREPGFTCTLCGDCTGTCKHNALQYRFLNLSPGTARILFLVLVVSLHAVFLAVARI